MGVKYPPVTIVLTTYFPDGEDGDKRIAACRHTVNSWEEYLHYDGNLFLHNANDGSARDLAFGPIGTDTFKGNKVTHSWQNRHGVGASLNAGFKAAFVRSPFVAYFVDDWALTQHFDITPWVYLMMQKQTVGMVRLGPPHPGNLGHIFPMSDLWQGWAAILDLQAGYAYAQRPALYHQRFIDAYGWFDEDCSAIICENNYSNRLVYRSVLNNPPGPDIVLALPHPWQHIESVELAYLDPSEKKE